MTCVLSKLLKAKLVRARVLAGCLVLGLLALVSAGSAQADVKPKPTCGVASKAGATGCRKPPPAIPLPPRRPETLDAPTQEQQQSVAPAQKPVFGTPNDVTLKPLTTAPSKKAVRDDATPEELLAAVNESLTALHQFSAKFSQVSGNGQQTSGHLTVLHPGRLRFDYDAPATITIIADGNNVAIIDTRLKTQDVYSIGLTPLKFLLGSTIDLSRDLKIVDIRVEGDRVIVEANDNATFGGVSQITLAFDTKNLLLRQWSVTDPQGYEVKVSLSAIDTKREVDPSLFVIPPRFPDQRHN